MITLPPSSFDIEIIDWKTIQYFDVLRACSFCSSRSLSSTYSCTQILHVFLMKLAKYPPDNTMTMKCDWNFIVYFHLRVPKKILIGNNMNKFAWNWNLTRIRKRRFEVTRQNSSSNSCEIRLRRNQVLYTITSSDRWMCIVYRKQTVHICKMCAY